LSAPCSSCLRDTQSLSSPARAATRPAPERRLLRGAPGAAARRLESRFQRGASVEALSSHEHAAPRCVTGRDRSPASPPATDDDSDLCQGRYRSPARHRPSVDGRCVMSSLRTSLDEYLAVRRALGYHLRLTGRLLRRFVEFAEHAHGNYITTELALAWATQPTNAQPAQWANRLAMVRRFAQYCA